MRIFLVLISVFAFAGCSSVPKKRSASPQVAIAATKRLYAGMTEEEALKLMKPVALNWGRVTYGETGAGELLFQVSATEQLKLHLEPVASAGSPLSPEFRAAPTFIVYSIGALEPKSEWELDPDHNLTRYQLLTPTGR
jgi:hypothetical protein